MRPNYEWSRMSPHCPKCDQPTAFSESGGWGCWRCSACDRVWMPGASMANVLKLTPGAPPLSSILLKAAQCKTGHSDLKCPTCRGASFGVFEAEVGSLDVCRSCGGVHFGPGIYHRIFPKTEEVSGGAYVAAEAAVYVLLGVLAS